MTAEVIISTRNMKNVFKECHRQNGKKVCMMHNADLSYGDSTFDMKDIRRSIGRSSRKLCELTQEMTKSHRALALLKVANDLFFSLNKGNIFVLALLDFSSAFDTIDHPILVHRLHTDFEFTDTVLQ